MFLDAVAGKAVEVALKIDLFQALEEEERSLTRLAQRCGVAERGLRPLLYLLSSLNLVKEGPAGFSPGDETKVFLEQSWPSLRESLPPAPDWDKLEEAVRTGRCPAAPIEGSQDGGSFFSGVVHTLFKLHWPVARHLAGSLPQNIKKVLDLGAGSAVWSLALALSRPEVKVVAVDHQKVLEEVTAGYVAQREMEKQYDLRAGSYHVVPLEAEEFDLVYLGHVVHSEGWQASESLLQRCRTALKPNGLLAIAEWIGSEPRSEDYHANLFDLNMLMFTEAGLVFSAVELENLAVESGFGECRWVQGPGKYPVLVAEKA